MPVETGFVARQDPHRLAAARSLCPTARQARCQCRQVTSCNRVSAQLLRTGQQHTELPPRLAQFKNHVNRGILASGGGGSPKEVKQLFPPRLVVGGGTTLNSLPPPPPPDHRFSSL